MVTFSGLFTIDLLLVYLVTLVICIYFCLCYIIKVKKRGKKNELAHFEREKKEMELFALKSQIGFSFFNSIPLITYMD